MGRGESPATRKLAAPAPLKSLKTSSPRHGDREDAPKGGGRQDADPAPGSRGRTGTGRIQLPLDPVVCRGRRQADPTPATRERTVTGESGGWSTRGQVGRGGMVVGIGVGKR